MERNYQLSFTPLPNCSVCNEQFLDLELLSYHILTHIGAVPYCSICKAVFITSWQLHNHLLSDHKVSSKIELLSGNPQCTDCIHHHGPELAFHYAHHIKQMPYSCEMCNILFFNENDFIIHCHLHKPDGEMNCEVCGKTFQEKLKCLLHVVTHNNHVLFQHFPNCELSDCALEFNDSLSSIRNTENILNSSDNNLLGIDSECRDYLSSVEFIDERCSDNSSQFEGYCNQDVGQFQKTDMCNTEDFDENDKNQRFPSVGNFTRRQSSMKEVWVILHKLPSCICNTYLCNNGIYVDNLKFVKTSNCCTSDTISGESCCVLSNYPHLCYSEKDIPALNIEQNISSNEISRDCGFKIPKVSISVLKSLWPRGPTKNQFKIAKGIQMNIYVPNSSWSYGQTKKCSSLFKEFNSYISNDDLKSVYLYSFEIADHHTEPNKDHVEEKMGSKLEISDCSKKPCIKLHKLCNDIFSLYTNNQPIILKKDISQETLNNADQLGDCSSVIEFNLESYAHELDNNYLGPDNFIIGDHCENYESVQSCESNTNILSHCDQVKLRDVSVKLHRLSDDNFINSCEKSNDRGNQKKYVDKQKIKSHVKKSEKKENTICKGTPNKTQKNKVVKKLLLRKKRLLLEKYMKSLLLTHHMKNFLLNVTYVELAETLKKLRNKSKKNQIDEEFVSFVRRIINSANFSKKIVKMKKCSFSGRVPLKNSKSSMPEKGENVASVSSKFKRCNIYLGYQAMEENPNDSIGIADEIADLHETVHHYSVGCSTNIKKIQNLAANKNIKNITAKKLFNSKVKKLNIHVGYQAMEENASTNKIINSSDSCGIPDETAQLHESVDHSVGCSTNIKEIQCCTANKNIKNVTAKKLLDDNIHIRSKTEDVNKPSSKKQVTNFSTLAKINECSALLNIVKTALKRRQEKKKKIE